MMSGYTDEQGIFIDNKLVKGAHFKDLAVNCLVVANGSTLVRTIFEGLRIECGTLGGGIQISEYVDCTFQRCRLELEVPGRARFTRCRFRDVRLSSWFCLNAEFIDCSFSGRLNKVVFDASLTPIDQAELGRTYNRYENNDFRKCKFKDVAFRGGIPLDPELLPEEPGGIFLPDAAEACAAALVKIREGETSEFATNYLDTALEYIRRGQNQRYIAPADLESRDPRKANAFTVLRNLLAPYDPRL
jgi:hypothetical protein